MRDAMHVWSQEAGSIWESSVSFSPFCSELLKSALKRNKVFKITRTHDISSRRKYKKTLL